MVEISWLSNCNELDYWKPVLKVIPIRSILGKLHVVPVGDTMTGTIPYHLSNIFPGAPGDRKAGGAPGDRKAGAGDACRMRFVNSWELGWSLDM